MKNLIKKLFGSTKQDTGESQDLPENWNLTISDLMNELKSGKRKQLGEPELTWAREYERSLIPTHYRFPKKGDLYESKQDQEIKFLISWLAPYTDGGKTTLFKGEKIWITSDPMETKAVGSYALPVNYKELELRIVPSIERNAKKYDGYYLLIETKVLNESFELIQENFVKEKFE